MLISNDMSKYAPKADDSDDYIIETRTPPPKNITYYSKRLAKIVWEIVSWGAIVSTLLFIYGVGTFNQVSGSSMATTLDDGMYVIGITSFFNPSHGDIVTANPSQTPDLDIIKRVIAVEGDELRFDGSQLFLNGELLDEPYILEPMKPVQETTIIIPDDHVWIMGDNRNNSSDSRQFGAVSVEDIIAKRIYAYSKNTD